ncbi:MAG: TIGR04197 family type VII secretion effector [Lactobacillus sp.]|jgi:type VII secretion effector (TIGR04197 family)|nr:TIGR04197 family type VII secretion effector [Lactobacillus sp.]MCI2033195.1 TIGR04197 family type VII secretion effector [Lactobacillus sp.]
MKIQSDRSVAKAHADHLKTLQLTGMTTIDPPTIGNLKGLADAQRINEELATSLKSLSTAITDAGQQFDQLAANITATDEEMSGQFK